MAFMAIVMLVSFSVNAMAYDSILFPYFTSGGSGDLTFIQIINTSALTAPATQGNLHYIYVYNSGTEVCQHADQNGKTSRNDIMLFEATNSTPGVTGQLLPGDTTSTSYILNTKPAWGYLTVTHGTGYGAGLEGELRGQAIVVNTSAGTAYSYNAINDPTEVDSGNLEFDDNVDDHTFLSFLPTSYASTVWFMFPIDGTDLADVAGPAGLVLNSTSEVGHHPYHADADGVYDNNENLYSYTKYFPVGCWNEGFDPSTGSSTGAPAPMTANFFYTPAQLIPLTHYNTVKNSGGWMGKYDWDYSYTYKITSSSILGKTMSTMVYEPNATAYLSYTR